MANPQKEDRAMKKFMKNTMIAGRQVNDAPIPANQSVESIETNDGAGTNANLAAS